MPWLGWTNAKHKYDYQCCVLKLTLSHNWRLRSTWRRRFSNSGCFSVTFLRQLIWFVSTLDLLSRRDISKFGMSFQSLELKIISWFLWELKANLFVFGSFLTSFLEKRLFLLVSHVLPHFAHRFANFVHLQVRICL